VIYEDDVNFYVELELTSLTNDIAITYPESTDKSNFWVIVKGNKQNERSLKRRTLADTRQSGLFEVMFNVPRKYGRDIHRNWLPHLPGVLQLSLTQIQSYNK
jgi:hypothetical protein